jgi:hypothetical protein
VRVDREWELSSFSCPSDHLQESCSRGWTASLSDEGDYLVAKPGTAGRVATPLQPPMELAMKVAIKDFDVEMDVRTNGIEFEVYDNTSWRRRSFGAFVT